MITETEFQKLAKRMMDRELKPFIRSKGFDFSTENQDVFVEHCQQFLFNELSAMGLWQKMMAVSNNNVG